MSDERRHWTESYRTDPLRLYEMEAPVFESTALTEQEMEAASRLAERLGTTLRSPVLDLACGPGRHSRWLTALGYRVTGLDLSAGFLWMARNGLSGTALSLPHYICGNLLALPLAAGGFRTALLLGKGFGYFSDADNMAVLEQAFETLEPGGFLCVELPERDAYLATLPEVEMVERRLSTGAAMRSRWRSEWNATSSRLHVDESHVLVDTDEVYWRGRWDVRLYDAAEVVELFRQVGFDRPTVESVELMEIEGARSEVLFVGAVR